MYVYVVLILLKNEIPELFFENKIFVNNLISNSHSFNLKHNYAIIIIRSHCPSLLACLNTCRSNKRELLLERFGNYSFKHKKAFSKSIHFFKIKR
jgi:hypothetical protein